MKGVAGSGIKVEKGGTFSVKANSNDLSLCPKCPYSN